MLRVLGFTLLAILAATACTKEPDFPDTPEISFERIDSNMIRQRVDSAFIIINFTDGDGDIGSSENERNIFLIDTRASQDDTIGRAMPPVPSFVENSGISGEIRLPISTCCEPPPGEEGCLPVTDMFPDFQRDTVIYKVYIVDRAGNQSNTITVDPIFLLCD